MTRFGTIRLASMGCAAWLLACAAEPPLVPLGPAETAEHTAVQIAACLPFADVASTFQNLETSLVLGDEITLAQVPVGEDELACLRAAGASCARILACLGISRLERVASCTPDAFRCDGDIITRCVELSPGSGSAGFSIVQDCGVVGYTCVELPDGGILAGCVEAPCGARYFECESDRVFRNCSGGALSRGRCREGTTCQAGACVGAGPPCTENRCEGDVLVSCDPTTGREDLRIDCPALGLRCETYPTLNDAGCSRIDGATCTSLPSCRDGTLTYCRPDGTEHTYDCTAHGFAGCEGSRCVGAP
jgi:hypothetical protein